MDDIAEESIGGPPCKHAGGPAAPGIAGPGPPPTETVLPGRQQWIALRALEHDVGRGARRGRDVAGQGWEAVQRDAGDHVGERGELRRDATLDDPGLERLARLLQENLRHV